MLYTHGAVAIALAQVFMPFLVLALYDVLQGTSPRVHEAAESLGASRPMRFWPVDLPLSLPGLRAGIVIVFLMSSTAYVSATLLGGKKVWTTGMLVWQEALQNLNAPLAAALALMMTGDQHVFAARRLRRRRGALMPWRSGRPAGAASMPALADALPLDVVGPAHRQLLLAGRALLLLLLPLVLVCIQSFNDVPQATVAGFRAFTLKWYAARAVRRGLSASLPSFGPAGPASRPPWRSRCALPAAFALARHRFRGLTALAAFWTLPLSLPHVAIGVGMLRLLQAYTALPPFLGLMAVHVVLMLPFCIACCRPPSSSSTAPRRKRRRAWAPMRPPACPWSSCQALRPAWRPPAS